jgi:hypothetical protein
LHVQQFKHSSLAISAMARVELQFIRTALLDTALQGMGQ